MIKRNEKLGMIQGKTKSKKQINEDEIIKDIEKKIEKESYWESRTLNYLDLVISKIEDRIDSNDCGSKNICDIVDGSIQQAEVISADVFDKSKVDIIMDYIKRERTTTVGAGDKIESFATDDQLNIYEEIVINKFDDLWGQYVGIQNEYKKLLILELIILKNIHNSIIENFYFRLIHRYKINATPEIYKLLYYKIKDVYECVFKL